MHIARGAGGNKPLFLLFQEYALESSDIREKYNSKVFAWYQRKLRALCDGTPFDDAKPAKTWGEAWDRTKERAKDKLQRINDKAVNLAHRADARLTRSRKVGRVWKKIRHTGEEGEEEPDQSTSADQKDMKEPAAKYDDEVIDEDAEEAAEDKDSNDSNEGKADGGAGSPKKKSPGASPAKSDDSISAAEEALKNAEEADMLHD